MKTAMNKINAPRLMDAYEATRAFSREDSAIREHFHDIESVFEAKKTQPDASIMIYGVYNAGKSTLINVLLGREEAAVDDIPKTDRVSSYKWGLYNILDTPGVDAPIEHENVTKAQMLKADAVIFVVDPVGTAEEAKTLSVLMDLLQEGKQVFLVFNEKKSISDEDFIRLKDQIRERLQQMAADRKLGEVLKDIPIIRINAKRALQGMLKEQPKLVELSGYPVFERQLKEFLQGISPDDIYARLKKQLTDFLKDYVLLLNDCSKSEIVKNYDKLLGGISVEKSRLRQTLDRDLSRHKSGIYEKSKAFMRTSPESCQLQIEKMLESSGQYLAASLNTELQLFVSGVQSEIDGLQAVLPTIMPADISVMVPALEMAVASDGAHGGESQMSQIDPALLKGAVDQITALAKPEHIVGSLQLVKSALPSLMKGIGVKTMEKWASVALTKWIPYVGTAISVLFDLFSSDSEEQRLRQQSEELQRAKERAQQQMEDFAREISEGFEVSMREIILNELDTFFAGIVEQVDVLRQGFSEIERANSQRLEKLLEIQQVALGA